MPEKPSLTQELRSKTPPIVSRSTPRSAYSIGEKTKAAWRVMRPTLRKTTRRIMYLAAIILVLWDVDRISSSTIYSGLGWFQDHILKAFPSAPFVLGMLTYHFILKTEKGPTSE